MLRSTSARSRPMACATPARRRWRPRIEGSAHEHAARTQRQRLEHVAAPAHAAVQHHRHVAGSVQHARQRRQRRHRAESWRPPWLETMMPSTPCSRQGRVVRMQDALDDQRAGPLPADAGHVPQLRWSRAEKSRSTEADRMGAPRVAKSSRNAACHAPAACAGRCRPAARPGQAVPGQPQALGERRGEAGTHIVFAIGGHGNVHGQHQGLVAGCGGRSTRSASMRPDRRADRPGTRCRARPGSRLQAESARCR